MQELKKGGSRNPRQASGEEIHGETRRAGIGVARHGPNLRAKLFAVSTRDCRSMRCRRETGRHKSLLRFQTPMMALRVAPNVGAISLAERRSRKEQIISMSVSEYLRTGISSGLSCNVIARIEIRAKVVAGNAGGAFNRQNHFSRHVLTFQPFRNVPLSFANQASEGGLPPSRVNCALQCFCRHGAH